MSRFATSDDAGGEAPPTTDIQQLLESTRRQIEERKRQTQMMLEQTQIHTPVRGLIRGVASLDPLFGEGVD